MNNIRLGRINSELKKKLSHIINNEIKNPNVKGLISITEVNTSADLKHCKVKLSIYNVSEQEKINCLNAIESSRGFIRSAVAKNFELKTCPEFYFSLDTSLDVSENINKILGEIKAKDSNK